MESWCANCAVLGWSSTDRAAEVMRFGGGLKTGARRPFPTIRAKKFQIAPSDRCYAIWGLAGGTWTMSKKEAYVYEQATEWHKRRPEL